MTTRRNIILIILLINSINAFSGTEFVCNVRYNYKIYHPAIKPATGYGSEIGTYTIFGTGSRARFEDVWSKTYTLNVKFFSGYELNEHYNNSAFDDFSIVGLITWDNGGYTFIIINEWVTNLKKMTEEEVKYNENGDRISYMTGIDNENRFWEFYF